MYLLNAQFELTSPQTKYRFLLPAPDKGGNIFYLGHAHNYFKNPFVLCSSTPCRGDIKLPKKLIKDIL
jgi:hypothetical protein